MAEIIEMAGATEATGYSYFLATSPENVRRHVGQLAEYVRKFAPNVLRGDQATFDALEKLRRKNSALLLKEWKLKGVRRDVESAWRERNYARVVELYESVKEDLMPSEMKKLEYAKKHLATSP